MVGKSRGTRAQSTAAVIEPKAFRPGDAARKYFFAVDPNSPFTGRKTIVRLGDVGDSAAAAAIEGNNGEKFLTIENYAFETGSKPLADYLTREIKAGRLRGVTPRIVVVQTCPICKEFEYETTSAGMQKFQAHLLEAHTDSDADASGEDGAE